MSIDVVSNPDGSYSVTCSGTTVTVGGPGRKPGTSDPDIGSDPGPIHWPEDPDENPGGTRAYMIVEPTLMGRVRSHLRGIPYASPAQLEKSIFQEVKLHPPRPRARGQQLEVLVSIKPGQSLDAEKLMARMQGLSERLDAKITLRIVSDLSKPGA
jgi:hypothetical protein